jgi:uncharacterized integral membrane protein
MTEKSKGILVMLIISIILMILAACNTRQYVITEYDGDREIRWYSDTTNKEK